MKSKKQKKHKNPAPGPRADGATVYHCAFNQLVPLEDLRPNPENPNKHSDEQVALLAKVIRYQGWRAPIVVSNLSGLIVAGHGRFEAAKLLDVAKAPVNFQDFATPEDETAHLLADNRLAELAEMDPAELQAILKTLDAEMITVAGYDPAELDEQIAAAEKAAAKEESAVAPSFQLLITCKDEAHQVEILEWLQDQQEGLEVRALTA